MRLTDKQRNTLFKTLEDVILELEQEWTMRAEQTKNLKFENVVFKAEVSINFDHPDIVRVIAEPYVVVE